MKGRTMSILPLLSLMEVKLISKLVLFSPKLGFKVICVFVYFYIYACIYILNLCLYMKCISIYTHTHIHTHLKTNIKFEGSGISRMKAPGFTIFLLLFSHELQSSCSGMSDSLPPLNCSTPGFRVHH